MSCFPYIFTGVWGTGKNQMTIGQQLAQDRFNRKANVVAVVLLALALIGAFIRFYNMYN